MGCCGLSGVCGTLLFAGNTVPFTGGSINIRTQLNPSEGINYGKNPEDRSIYNYSRGKTVVEGNFTIEVFGSGGYAAAFSALLRHLLNPPCAGLDGNSGSGSSGSLQFSPNGGTEIDIPGSDGQAVISSMTLNGNPGGVVSASFGFLSTTYKMFDGGLTPTWQFETVGPNDDSNPLPYYAASLVFAGAGGDTSFMNNYLIDWSLSVNTNPTPIYTFCDDTATTANKILLGTLKPTGNIKYVNPAGAYSSKLKDGASLAITLGTTTIRFPHIAFINDSLPNSGNNAVVARTVDWEGFGSDGRASVYI